MPYITAAFLRDPPYNLSVTDYPDPVVEAAILVWQQALERVCRQWFEPRAAVVRLDGTNSDTLHFAVPIITCNSLNINDELTELDTDFYEVYNNRTGWPDDRRNPRIKLRRGRDGDIFTRGSQPCQKFLKGRRNQTIDGVWGFTEDDDSTPLLIQRALALLVIEKLTQPAMPPATPPSVPPLVPTGLIIEEETDDHRIRYQPPGGTSRARNAGLLGLTNNPEVLRIITLYKAPIGMATPADWTF
jgi:hypothetical protein